MTDRRILFTTITALVLGTIVIILDLLTPGLHLFWTWTGGFLFGAILTVYALED